jgi:hypothetical protein
MVGNDGARVDKHAVNYVLCHGASFPRLTDNSRGTADRATRRPFDSLELWKMDEARYQTLRSVSDNRSLTPAI